MIKSCTIPRICIAGTQGGSGKTLLSLGLASALSQKGYLVKPYKKGPDYIDAAWLALASQNSCTNLDPFFLDAPALLRLFISSFLKTANSSEKTTVALIEGNRGIYDGMDINGACSTAQLARILSCPLILCINVSKATRTIAAIIKGLTSFETGLVFGGVILNNVGSERHASNLRKIIEEYTDLTVLGGLPRLSTNPLPERHMGLASHGPDLKKSANTVIENLGSLVRANCDINAILKSMRCAPELKYDAIKTSHGKFQDYIPKIGVIRDASSWFYYQENLDALANAGCETICVSLLDKSAWPELDGIYMGGGFPEDYAQDLSSSPHLEALRKFAIKGMPIYAECGGMIILCASLTIADKTWPMAGIFPCDIFWQPKPSGLGYVSAKIIAANPWYETGMEIRGHEFHYSFGQCQSVKFVMRLSRGSGFCANNTNLDGLVYNCAWGSYTHIFAPTHSEWAASFHRLAAKYHEKNKI